jgi:hypothetical protein
VIIIFSTKRSSRNAEYIYCDVEKSTVDLNKSGDGTMHAANAPGRHNGESTLPAGQYAQRKPAIHVCDTGLASWQ